MEREFVILSPRTAPRPPPEASRAVGGLLPPLEGWLRDMPGTVLCVNDVPAYLTTDHPLSEQLFHAPTVKELKRFLELHRYKKKEGKHEKWVSEDGADFFSLSHNNKENVTVFHKLLRKFNLTKQEYLARRHEW